uniref:Uncharacterized protein n=1 Tax=Arundo donax TaxID=35708 RepID=A0A0A9LXG4_ARUDO
MRGPRRRPRPRRGRCCRSWQGGRACAAPSRPLPAAQRHRPSPCR